MKQNKILSNISVYLAIFIFMIAVTAFSVNAATATLVDLGTSGNFAILSKAQITDVNPAVITGDVGASPITGASIHISCSEVTGNIRGVDAAYTGGFDSHVVCFIPGTTGDTPNANKTYLDTAVGDMGIAYTAATAEAAGVGPFLDVGTGTLGIPGTSDHFVPGVYTWGTSVTMPTDIYLDGNSTDVWVFQISGTLDTSSATQVHLTGGALARNVFWAVSGATTLGTTSIFEGNILTTATSHIAMLTGSTLHGRALSDGEVWLQSSTVTIPASGPPPSPLLTTIKLLPSLANLTVGSTHGYYIDLNATSFDQFSAPFAATISYNSSNVSVATVDVNGNVTAVAPGNATITAFNGNVSGSSNITVVMVPTYNPLPNTAQLYTTTSVPLSVITSQNATCRYDTTDIPYDNMTLNFTDNITQHSAVYTVTSGTSYTLYARCRNVFNSTDNTSTVIAFSVDSVPVVSTPARSGGGGGGGSGSGAVGSSGSNWICSSWSVCDSAGISTETCTLPDGSDTSVYTKSCTPTQASTPDQVTTPTTPQTTGSEGNGQNTAPASQDNTGSAPTYNNQITGDVTSGTSATGIGLWWNNFMTWLSRLFGGK